VLLEVDTELSENGALDVELLKLEAPALDVELTEELLKLLSLLDDVETSLELLVVSDVWVVSDNVDSETVLSDIEDSENDVSDAVVGLLGVENDELLEVDSEFVGDEYEELLKLLGVLLEVEVLVLLNELVGDE